MKIITIIIFVLLCFSCSKDKKTTKTKANQCVLVFEDYNQTKEKLLEKYGSKYTKRDYDISAVPEDYVDILNNESLHQYTDFEIYIWKYKEFERHIIFGQDKKKNIICLFSKEHGIYIKH